MTTRLAARFGAGPGRLLFACSLLRCTVEYQLERRVETAAPAGVAEACVKLGHLLSSSAAQAAEQGNLLPPGDERGLAYGQYCQPAQAAATGWENCAEPGGWRSPSCSGPVLPYLICLADPELVPVSECAPLAPTCAALPEAPPQVLDAAQACEIGVSFDGRSSPVFAYTVLASNCSDGNSYGFTCEPPDAACVSSCACSRNAALSARISFDVSTELIDQAIWDACGLPELVPGSR